MRRGTFVRWGVPIAAAAVIGAAIGAGPVIAAVSGDPVLPERSAEQLLADAAAATSKQQGIAPMSGTVQQTASLGLPALPQTGGETSPLSLLSGSHEVKVWYGGDQKFRVAMPTQLNETNLIVNGDQGWYWDSATNTATKLTVKAGGEQQHKTPVPQPTDLTPAQVAQRMLEGVDEHSSVRVINTAEVAGRPAYQLVLAPKDEGSLVQEVRIALDGETYVPLQVQLFAKGSAEPAYQVGFTQVTFTTPAEENFTFTPPAGAKVEEATLGGEGFGKQAEERAEHAADVAGEAKWVGDGWSRVAVVPFKLSDLQAQTAKGGEDGNAAAMLDTVLKSATPVSGTWGSGKLIKTKLVTALLTDDGRLLAGAVTPEEIIKAAGIK
ncbi:LolA family protein [Nonomuraea turcica]|uniref:LolA family protein n=1 Tax=Nonomuraea sp. G32 TaxID=3067274 RepID=UPI00273AB079|nr:sigma-E factor regulatory protein RseB domain-containing protein [Nonomuraea sp. G32]MDP4504234.1 sigma-E factor regulatory protein RseB domain-containing protein [Nonomuraea sp. G32]